jgi:hypothetical protein
MPRSHGATASNLVPVFRVRRAPFFTPFAASLRRLGSVVTAPHNGGYGRPAAPTRSRCYDVLRGRTIVGRIMLSNGSAASQWVWTVSYHYHEDRTPTHGYASTRDAAMKAFSRSWHRE